MKRKKIKVGFDFDGVIAYNPFRIIRWPVSYFKKNILGIKKLQFWYPEKRWQQIFWTILHESSVFPARGIDLLKELIEQDRIEAHLITARFSFLDNHLYKWLEKYHLKKLFKTITLNKHDEQPHIFKEKMIEKEKLDYFVEDNWDIVRYLNNKQKTINLPAQTGNQQSTRIYWIYNILDHFVVYPHKFPYLGKALEEIEKLLR